MVVVHRHVILHHPIDVHYHRPYLYRASAYDQPFFQFSIHTHTHTHNSFMFFPCKKKNGRSFLHLIIKRMITITAFNNRKQKNKSKPNSRWKKIENEIGKKIKKDSEVRNKVHQFV